MWTIWLCIGVAVVAFAFGVAGLYLQKLLPEPHTADRSRDMIGAIVGLISLLLALVLGTLVGSAYSFYATQKSEMETFAARAHSTRSGAGRIRAGDGAGAGANERSSCKGSARWCGAETSARPRTLSGSRSRFRTSGNWTNTSPRSIPKTPAQRQFAAAASADARAIEHTRLLISLQLASSVSWPLVVIVVSWGLILFCGYGLLSRINATTLTALALGAFAVGSALFLDSRAEPALHRRLPRPLGRLSIRCWSR